MMQEQTSNPPAKVMKAKDYYYRLTHTSRKALLIPLAAWYLLWQASAIIPHDIRPSINVGILHDLDRLLFNTLPHQVMTYYHCDHLDLLMAIPYTLHVAWPVSFLLWTIIRSRSLVLPFANCFGLLSFMAVITELIFPCAPPWYFEKYGLAPANYNLPGDAGGLLRLDKRFEMGFYDGTFSKSPLVFGAFPSLHCAWPTLVGLFLWHNVCPKWHHRAPVVGYIAWVCLAVVYLHHHYVVDAIGGILYAWLAYQVAGPHCDAVKATESSPTPSQATTVSSMKSSTSSLSSSTSSLSSSSSSSIPPPSLQVQLAVFLSASAILATIASATNAAGSRLALLGAAFLLSSTTISEEPLMEEPQSIMKEAPTIISPMMKSLKSSAALHQRHLSQSGGFRMQ